MATITASPAAMPVSVTMPRAFMPMATNPAVSPASSVGTRPCRIIFQRPTIHSMPKAMQVLMTGIKRAK